MSKKKSIGNRKKETNNIRTATPPVVRQGIGALLARDELSDALRDRADQAPTDERQQFIKLYKKLRDDTFELRSSLTALVLHTEEMETFSESHKECIIRICDVINKKNDELIFSEKLMKEVILQFHPHADI